VLHAGVRALLVLGAAAGLAWLTRDYLYRPLRATRNEETTALQLESRFPALRDRLISVIQLTAAAGDAAATVSPRLLEKLERDTAAFSASLDFSEVINWRFVRRVLMVSAALFLAAVLSTLSFPEHVKTVVRRMAFGDAKYPTKTTIRVEAPATRLVVGQDWRLRAELEGRIPRVVRVRVRLDRPKARWETYAMRPLLGYRYGLTLEKVQHGFAYQVIAGDARTAPARVDVVAPVSVLNPTLTVTPPPHLRAPPRRGVALHGARVLDGSSVEIRVPCTKALQAARLVTTDGAELALAPERGERAARGRFRLTTRADGADTAGATALVAPSGALRFRLHVRDLDGLEDPEPRAVYSIRIVEDGAPSAVIVAPKGERRCVPFAVWRVRYRLSDDYGLARAWVQWALTQPEAEEETEEGAGSASEPRTDRLAVALNEAVTLQQGEIDLKMAAIGPQPGDTVEVWLVAADARAPQEVPLGQAFGPGWSRSESVTFRVVAESEKIRDAQERLTGVEENIAELHSAQRRVKVSVDQLRSRKE
jgi:hypothetical protein